MDVKMCHCALPAITGSTDCCKTCKDNPEYNTGYDDMAGISLVSKLKPIHTCPKCMEVFMADEANYCPKCGTKIVKVSNKIVEVSNKGTSLQ